MKCGYRLDVETLPDGKKKYQCPYCKKYNSASGLHRDLHIDDFVLLEKLGSGGMGEVWKAHQQSMNRDVALKILSPELSGDAAFVKRFLNEAVITGRLRHPNIITAYTAGSAGEYYYLATMFVDGIELQDKIRIDGMLPEREALTITKTIAAALCYAWEHHEMLHCDIKPANIMIDKFRVPYLMDMGISKIASEKAGEDKTPGTAKIIAGSLQYMSPEQAAGNVELDFRTDIYSLGVTLYQMVTAALPFDNKNLETALRNQGTAEFSPPATRNPYLTTSCSELILQMMAYNREDRQSDWNYVIADINSVLAGTYVSRKKVRVKKWDSIKPRKKPGVNAPISLDRKTKTEEADPAGKEVSTSTRKIVKEPPADTAPAAPPKVTALPPVVFDAAKDRKSGLKLLILSISLGVIILGVIIYFSLRFFKVT